MAGWMPWMSSMGRSCGEAPWGIPWNCIGGSWLGGCHGCLPWEGHVAKHHGASHGIALGAHGWVDAMDVFHGKVMWRSTMGHPMELHWGLMAGWMPWMSSMGRSCGEAPWGIPWNCIGGSWLGGCHGCLPWEGHVEKHHGASHGIA